MAITRLVLIFVYSISTPYVNYEELTLGLKGGKKRSEERA
jgi:hypothetical protein